MAHFDELLLGKLLCDDGVTKDDLLEGIAQLEQLARAGKAKTIGELLFERGAIPLDKVAVARRKIEDGIPCPKCAVPLTATDHPSGDQLYCMACKTVVFDLAEGTLKGLVDSIVAKGTPFEFGQKDPERAAAPDRDTKKDKGPRAMIGKTIGGCRITGLLTETDLMCVYGGEELEAKREDAVKVFFLDRPAVAKQAPGFAREARSSKRLDHENIVHIRNVGEAKEYVFIVEERVEGMDLVHLVRSQEGKVATGDALAILKKCCQGLAHAHQRQVLHRDLRPENVIFTRGGGVKVKGFGMARPSEAAKCFAFSGEVMGVANYLAPELIDLKSADKRADIYALGCVFYFLLTGHAPFEGQSATNVLFSQLAEAPAPLDRARPDVPAPVVTLCSRLMAKDVAERYQSASEVISDLKRIEKGDAPRYLKAPAKAAEAAAEETKEPTPDIETLTRKSPLPRLAIGALALCAAALVVALVAAGPIRPPTPAVDEIAASLLLARTAPPRGDSPEQRRDALAALRSIEERFPGTGAARDAQARIDSIEKQAAAATEAAWEEVARASERAAQAGDLVAAWHAFDALPAELARDALAKRLADARAQVLEQLSAKTGMILVPDAAFVRPSETAGAPGAPAVWIAEFLMDRAEVTNAEYAAFVRSTKHAAPTAWPGGAPPAGRESYPVTGVSLGDAEVYARWAGKRLPSEVEWERAALGDDGRLWPWADGDAIGNLRAAGIGGPTAAGAYPRGTSPVGCVDMVGNAWEWVARGPGTLGVMRGGSWASEPVTNPHVIDRRERDPNVKEADIGFRCAR